MSIARLPGTDERLVGLIEALGILVSSSMKASIHAIHICVAYRGSLLRVGQGAAQRIDPAVVDTHHAKALVQLFLEVLALCFSRPGTILDFVEESVMVGQLLA